MKPFKNGQFCPKIKEDEDFNRSNTLSISRIEIRV
jgi:hypothetical protein